MRWQGRRESDNVEDQRDGASSDSGLGGGLGGNMGGNAGGGLGGLLGALLGGKGKAVGGVGFIVIIAIAVLMGADPTKLLQGGAQQSGQYQSVPNKKSTTSAEEDELARFVKVVLADNEDIWIDLMRKAGHEYRLPKMVLFSHATHSGCGSASSETGPFYCPADEKIYIDLEFYQLMKNRFKAGGDFAMAYVVAHEVGHHVQHVLGISDKVHRAQQRLREAEANKLSVKLELQADFLAGVWAHHDQKTKNILEEGDIEEALRCAEAIGDDRLQMQAQGYVAPESFTHGTSKERMYWFKKGFETGDIRQGDTFKDGL